MRLPMRLPLQHYDVAVADGKGNRSMAGVDTARVDAAGSNLWVVFWWRLSWSEEEQTQLLHAYRFNGRQLTYQDE